MKRAVVTLLAAIGVHGHLSADQRNDVGVVALQSTPAAGATLISKVWDLSPANLVAYTTFLLIVLQVGHLVWKWRRDARREADRIRGNKLLETDLGTLGADD